MAAKFCAGYSQPKQFPCACANRFTQDTASVANFQTVFVAHVGLDLRVSFDKKQLCGTAQLRLRLPERDSETPPPPVSTVKVSLDIHEELKVSRVEATLPKLASQGLPFKVEPFTRFGQALIFEVPVQAFAVVASETEDAAMPKAQEEAEVTIHYVTTPASPATTWLAPEQTHGKRKPYLFTQGQACLNRALFPCMDTPAVRFTYEAAIRVPAGFTAVMSAERCQEENQKPVADGADDEGYSVFRFRMPQPIPSYLVALAVGELSSRRIGPRSEVWCEPSQIDAASYEFDGMPEMYLAAGESLFGEYRWSTYDILVMPPSFPYGGMENPRMAFVTPCLLTGDRSLGDVIAHEIAHCWFGNLVTNANWSEFWLNEGFTMFAQRRITDVVHGKAFTALEAMTGRKILEDDVNDLGEEHVLTRLRCPIEAGVDPEDTYNECPYEKGFAMVSYLRSCVGSSDAAEQDFDLWLGRYANHFAFTSIVAEDMFSFFFESYPNLKEKVDVEVWLHKPGMPTWLPDLSVGQELTGPVEDLLQRWRNGSSSEADVQALLQEKAAVASWVTYQRLYFLDLLLEASDALPPDVLDKLGEHYGFIASRNAEIQYRYGLVLIKKRITERYGYISDFLRSQGKQKYTLPLYKALTKQAVTADGGLAQDLLRRVWRETKDCLHANVQLAVTKVFAAEAFDPEAS